MESKLYVINDGIVKYNVQIYIFYIDRKYKMTTIARHSFNVGPYGKMNEYIFPPQNPDS